MQLLSVRIDTLSATIENTDHKINPQSSNKNRLYGAAWACLKPVSLIKWRPPSKRDKLHLAKSKLMIIDLYGLQTDSKFSFAFSRKFLHFPEQFEMVCNLCSH